MSRPRTVHHERARISAVLMVEVSEVPERAVLPDKSPPERLSFQASAVLAWISRRGPEMTL